jgi:hypothetical protein
MGFFSKLGGLFRRTENKFPDDRPYAAYFIFIISIEDKTAQINQLRHDAEQTVLSALERELRNSGGWISLSTLLGASETFYAPMTIPSPNDMSALKSCVKWRPEDVELLGISADGIDDARLCHVVCLMPLGRTIVEQAQASIRKLAGNRFRGVVLHHPASRKKAAQFASELKLPLFCEINHSQARGWSLDQAELRQLGLEVFQKPPAPD